MKKSAWVSVLTSYLFYNSARDQVHDNRKSGTSELFKEGGKTPPSSKPKSKWRNKQEYIDR